MRQLLSGLALAAVIATGAVAPANAQNLFQTVVYVNDSAVTRYEIVQRQRFMQVIGAPDTSAEAAETALIDDRLRVEAAEAIGAQLSDEQLQSGLEEFAGRAGLDAASFIARLEQAGVDADTFRDFVRAGTLWRQVVRARLLPQIEISDAQVDQQLKRVIETPIIDRVAISELIIPPLRGRRRRPLRWPNASPGRARPKASSPMRPAAIPRRPRPRRAAGWRRWNWRRCRRVCARSSASCSRAR